MDRTLSFLGMCKKAGALETGEETVDAATRKGKTFLILTASDAAENTVRKAKNYAERGKNVLVNLPYTKEELGAMLGNRPCAIMAVTDISMATGLAEKLKSQNVQHEELLDRLYKTNVRKSNNKHRLRGQSAGQRQKGRNANGEI